MPPVSPDVMERAEAFYEAPIAYHDWEAQEDLVEPDGLVAQFAVDSVERFLASQNNAEVTNVATRLRIADALRDFVAHDRLGQTELRNDQKNVFEKLLDFAYDPPVEEDGTLATRCYIKKPTATGKTAVFSVFAEALSRSRPESEGQPLRGLVLSHRRKLVDQTVGDSSRGMTRFGSRVKVSKYYTGHQDLSGDVVAMTYQSLIAAVKRGEIDQHSFDYIICDEAHRSLGENTRAALEQISQGRLVIGLTATTELRDKKVEDFYLHKIHDMEIAEAINLDLLAPVEAHLIVCEERLKYQGRGYSHKELAKLMDNEWRNQKAVEFAKVYIQSGRQGIISCLPGDGARHAKDMAKLLQQEDIQEYIIDPKDGKRRLITRKIRAEAITGTTKNTSDIYERYDRGDIDVLTYVEVINEGWDSERAKFLINLRPTSSPMYATQRLGRVLRQFGDQSAIVLEFVHYSNKPQYTFWHIVGEDDYEYQHIVQGLQGRHRPRAEQTLELPPELQDLVKSMNHKKIRDFALGPEHSREASEEVLNIDQLARRWDVRPFTLRRAISNLVDTNQLEVHYYMFDTAAGPRRAMGFDAQAQALLMAHPLIKIPGAPEGYASTTALAKQLGFEPRVVAAAVEHFVGSGEQFKQYRFGVHLGTVTLAISPAQQELIKNYLIDPEIGSGAKSLPVFARELGVTKEKLAAYVDDLDQKGAMELKRSRLGRHKGIVILTVAQQNVLRKIPELSIPEAPEGYLTPLDLARKLRVDRDKVIAQIDRIRGQGQAFDEFRFVRPGTSPFRSIGLSPAQQAQITAIVEVVKLPDATIKSPAVFAKELGFRPETLKAFIDQSNALELAEMSLYRFGKRVARGLTAEQQDWIASQPQFSKPPKQTISVQTFARRLGLSADDTKSYLLALIVQGYSFKQYNFRGNIDYGLSSQEQQQILDSFPDLLSDTAESAQPLQSFMAMHKISEEQLEALIQAHTAQVGPVARYKFRKVTERGLTGRQRYILRKIIEEQR